METFIETLYETLDEQLQAISANHDYNGIQKAKRSLTAVKAAIRQLKDYILEHSFTDEKEEITFFKHTQPQFYSLHIYYVCVASIETRIPVGGKEEKEKFYRYELRRIRSFFDRNIDIYKYYRHEADYLDKYYFLRDNFDNELLIDDSYLYDARFATKMSYQFARIKATEQIELYIKVKLDELNDIRPPEPHPLKWKGKKVLLAEVLYMLHANGVFGNIKLKLLADTITRDWNCPITNIYKTLEEIRLRKKNRLPGLQQMIAGTERKMDEDDLNAR
jgi:hypothetical protein